MKIIPVIDLKNGIVVSARQGKRDSYQAIKSKLCSSFSIDSVINGFLSIHDFSTLYIADLDAICNTGSNQSLINQAVEEFRTIEFWIDNGTELQNITEQHNKNYRLIVGSECQSLCSFKDLASSLRKHILSLDFFPGHGYTGPSELIDHPEFWPNDIIIMTLDRVGSGSGPDFEKLNAFRLLHQEKNIIAAGGIRDENDLIRLKKMGINHTLISSSLHDGTINTHTIKKLQAKKYPV